VRKNPLPPPVKTRTRGRTLQKLTEAYRPAPIELWVYAAAIALQNGYELVRSEGWLPDEADRIEETIEHAKRWAVDHDGDSARFLSEESSALLDQNAKLNVQFLSTYGGAANEPNDPEGARRFRRLDAQINLVSAATNLAFAVGNYANNRNSLSTSVADATNTLIAVVHIYKSPQFFGSSTISASSKILQAEEIIGDLLKSVMSGRYT
jgi:hypothetical protein